MSKALLKFFGDKPLDQIEPGDVEKYKGFKVTAFSVAPRLTTACTRPRIEQLSSARLGHIGVDARRVMPGVRLFVVTRNGQDRRR